MKKDDVKVTVDQGDVTIEGDASRERKTRPRSTIASRVSTARSPAASRFRRIRNADGIRCESKDGVLIVHIPKTKPEAASKPKQIKVD